MRSALVPIAALLLVSGSALANELEMSIQKTDGTGGDEYRIFFEATKTGATTCGLTTPEGSYTCSAVVGGTLHLPAAFFSDHTYTGGSALTDLGTAIGSDWTLTWDSGLGTETVATICFGTNPLSGGFLDVPVLSAPVDGSTGNATTVGMTWGYGATPACTAQTDLVEASMDGPAGGSRDSGELACSVLSWTPATALTKGSWTATIHNGGGVADVVSGWLEAPDATLCSTPTGDSWSLTNGDWLAYESVDSAAFGVGDTLPSITGPGLVVFAGAMILSGAAALRRRSSH